MVSVKYMKIKQPILTEERTDKLVSTKSHTFKRKITTFPGASVEEYIYIYIGIYHCSLLRAVCM
jgi:hypothetical protein